MAKVKKSIIINSPVEKVFNYISDPMSQLEWLPSMMEVKNVNGSEVGQKYHWKYRMAGVPLEGETTVIEYIPNKRIMTKSKGGANSTWIFDFETQDGGTKVDLEIEYSIPVPVIGKLAEKIVLRRNEREGDLAMANIKDKMEG